MHENRLNLYAITIAGDTDVDLSFGDLTIHSSVSTGSQSCLQDWRLVLEKEGGRVNGHLEQLMPKMLNVTYSNKWESHVQVMPVHVPARCTVADLKRSIVHASSKTCTVEHHSKFMRFQNLRNNIKFPIPNPPFPRTPTKSHSLHQLNGTYLGHEACIICTFKF